GIEPEAIEGEQNPTLILEEGEEYEIGWPEGDGVRHNIEIWDEDGDVVDDYETDLTDDPGDDQILTITATEEMAAYRCRPHGSMEGEIRVE
ncbi:blue (type 1) copper domain-containing protein, partial [Natronococcus amylolyticus DSM 10524]